MSWFFGLLLVLIGGVALGGGYDYAVTVAFLHDQVHLGPGTTMLIGAIIAFF